MYSRQSCLDEENSYEKGKVGYVHNKCQSWCILKATTVVLEAEQQKRTLPLCCKAGE